MLYRKNQSKEFSYAHYGAMSERAIYKTYRRFNLRRQHLVTLLQCYEIQRNLNVLLSAKRLQPIACLSLNSLYSAFSILSRDGYLEQVLPKFRRKVTKGTKPNKSYSVTIKGVQVARYFSRMMKEDVRRLEAMGEWRPVNKRATSYYESLGLFNVNTKGDK